jgi:uncharacterized protein YjbJ (UPF0337 family)
MGDKTDRAKGKAKEAAGQATGDKGLKRQGRRDQEKGHLKKAGEGLKDAVKKAR